MTGSRFFQSISSSFFSIDGRSSSRRAPWGGLGQLPGPLWWVLGRSQGLCGWSWTALRASVGGPGPSWCLCWRSWAILGPLLGAMLAVLGRSWGLCWRSWASCWRSWRLLGPLLAVLSRLALKKVEEHHHLENVLISRVGVRSAAWRAVLSRSWGLCWRSWGALGAYVGGLGALLGSTLAVLAAPGAFVGGFRPLLGPMLAVLGCSWGPCWRSWERIRA